MTKMLFEYVSLVSRNTRTQKFVNVRYRNRCLSFVGHNINNFGQSERERWQYCSLPYHN